MTNSTLNVNINLDSGNLNLDDMEKAINYLQKIIIENKSKIEELKKKHRVSQLKCSLAYLTDVHEYWEENSLIGKIIPILKEAIVSEDFICPTCGYESKNQSSLTHNDCYGCGNTWTNTTKRN